MTALVKTLIENDQVGDFITFFKLDGLINEVLVAKPELYHRRVDKDRVDNSFLKLTKKIRSARPTRAEWFSKLSSISINQKSRQFCNYGGIIEPSNTI